MRAAEPAPIGPPWVQILMTLVGVLGGAGGLAAAAGVILQRRKYRADAADVLTDTALVLIEPLKSRVAELEQETTTARRKAAEAGEQADKAGRQFAQAREQAEAANVEIAEMRDSLAEVLRMLERWRAAVLDPAATLERLRMMVTADRRFPNGRGDRLDD